MGEGEKKVDEGGAGGEKKAADGGGKKDDGPATTVVLKLDLHCEGCAKKVRRSISHLEGVEKVKADFDANKLTVTANNVDPAWLRQTVESKTKKKVELISPPPKKDDGGGGAATATAAAAVVDKKAEEEKAETKTEENKTDDNKKAPKEDVVSTVVMKIRLHCDGCAHKIKRIILKNFEGVNTVTTDLPKDLVTITGTMNVKELVTYLKEKLKRGVEIIPPPKKINDGGENKKETGGAAKKESGGGGTEKKEEEQGGGEKKQGGDPKVEGGGGGGKKVVEVNKMEHHSNYNPETYYAMPVPMYGQSSYDAHRDYGHVTMYHDDEDHHREYYSSVVRYRQEPPLPPPTILSMSDHDMFSDENPNGCFIM